MTYLNDFIDAGRAKTAVEDAYRCKHPERTSGFVAAYKADAAFVFVVIVGANEKNWWSVSRSTFEAAEISEPDDWPK